MISDDEMEYVIHDTYRFFAHGYDKIFKKNFNHFTSFNMGIEHSTSHMVIYNSDTLARFLEKYWNYNGN
jgi:hypothetical protein